MSKILIIDDDLEICSLVKRALEKEGHQVTSQPDPIQAETMPLDLFDLILLDVMMPGKDGFTLCRDIQGAGWTARSCFSRRRPRSAI